jgi:hypothetical protein
LEHSLPFNILFGIALSSILSTCPNHLIVCDLINLTRSSPINNVFSSLFYLILHTLFSITDPYILRIFFLSNIPSAFSSVTISIHVYTGIVFQNTPQPLVPQFPTQAVLTALDSIRQTSL